MAGTLQCIFAKLPVYVNCVGQQSAWRSLPDAHRPELMLAALALKRRAELVSSPPNSNGSAGWTPIPTKVNAAREKS